MTAINHALTGAIIGLVVGEPLIALPTAVASHFVCDALPHFGSSNPDKTIKTPLFRNYLIIEAFLCFALVVILVAAQPIHWQLAAICAFLAASPDFLWINRFRTIRRGHSWNPNLFSRFAAKIQWFQRPIGLVVEATWLIASIVILVPLIG